MTDTRVIHLLGRQEILDALDTQTEVVDVPEWGGAVTVKGLSGTERDAFEADNTLRKGKNIEINLRNIRARLVQLSTIDPDGKRLFTFADLDALGAKSAKALDRVFAVAMKLSGLSQDDVDELAKNSESDQNAVSISA